MPERVPIYVITCRGCRREVEQLVIDNELVGKQEQLRCQACGHRGARIIRTWTWADKKTPGVVPGA